MAILAKRDRLMQATQAGRATPAEQVAPSTVTLDAGPERRRQQALAMLERNPALRIAVVADSSRDPVRIAVAIRDKGTVELHVSASRFCPFKLWELVAQQSGTLH